MIILGSCRTTAGRFRKFNLMQDKLSSSSDLLKKIMDKVYCVLNTDCVAATNFRTLAHNVKLLKSICPVNIFLLIQNKNFEDELSYVPECNNLCDKFNLKHSSQKDLKRHLAQSVSYSKIVSKENLTRYCRRPDEKKIVLFESSCMRNPRGKNK